MARDRTLASNFGEFRRELLRRGVKTALRFVAQLIDRRDTEEFPSKRLTRMYSTNP